MAIDRIMITPSCQSHADLLNFWAGLEGRSVSSLCSSLLEDAVYRAIESGRVNSTALRMMEGVIKQREAALQIPYKLNLSLEKEKSAEINSNKIEQFKKEIEEGQRKQKTKSEELKAVIDNNFKSLMKIEPKGVISEKIRDNSTKENLGSYNIRKKDNLKSIRDMFHNFIYKHEIIENNDKDEAFKILKNLFFIGKGNLDVDEVHHELKRIEDSLKHVDKKDKFNLFRERVQVWERELSMKEEDMFSFLKHL